jgi:hypothetical protein
MIKKYIYHKGIEILVVADKLQDFPDLEETILEFETKPTIEEIELKFKGE